MRDFKGMKRQRSRNRNGGGGGGGGGGNSGGGKPQHNTNRAFDSNGPEGVKVRGAAQHVYEKYQQLARDAQTSGDRVLAENYLQHAEHYFRLMRAMQPQRPLSEIIGRDQFVSGYDIDFEEESGGNDAGEADSESDAGDSGDGSGDRQPRFEGRRDDYRQSDRQPDFRGRDDSARADRAIQDRSAPERASENSARQDRASQDRPFQDRSGQDRAFQDRPVQERTAPVDRPREERAPRQVGREDRPRFNRDERLRTERAERVDRDPLGVIEPEATPLTPVVAPVSDAPMLRADDGEISHAPAFLQVRPAEGGEEVRRPRRRRTAAAIIAEDSPSEAPDASEP